MKVKSQFASLVFFLLLPLLAFAETYNYSPEVVTLYGTIKRAVGYGPDEKKVIFPAIKLSNPITVQDEAELLDNTTYKEPIERGVTLMQLVITDKKTWALLEPLKEKKVYLTGTMFHSHTAHHHTPVLIEVSKIVQVDGEKQKKKVQGEYQKVEEVVVAWSEAHNIQDLNGFARVFAPKVKFYGKELAANKIINEKNRLLNNYSNFHQEIVGGISCEQKNQYPIYQCDFTKRVVYGDKKKDFPSYLVIDTSAKEPRIIVESDYITDRNLK